MAYEDDFKRLYDRIKELEEYVTVLENEVERLRKERNEAKEVIIKQAR